MSFPYLLRLVCLCFASFFLVHAIFGVIAWMAAARAVKASESMRPRAGAQMLLMLRLLPAAIAILAVAGLCIPSYLWLEGNMTGEQVSLTCFGAALLGLAICIRSLAGTAQALWVSIRHSRKCEREGRHVEAGKDKAGIVLVNGEGPLVALVGVIRPRVVVSRAVICALSPEELKAALEHERVHWKSRDNFKRLLLSLVPEVFPFSRSFTALERCWARLTEWAADDDAVSGDSRMSLSLAAALVQIARMGVRAVPPLASSLLENGELSARVERLLVPAPVREPARRGMRVVGLPAAILVMAAIAITLWPAALHSVHVLLEHLIR